MASAATVRASLVCERQVNAARPWHSQLELLSRHVYSSGAELQFSRCPRRPCCATSRTSLVARPASLDTNKAISDPFAEKVVYHDDLVSRVLIDFITMKISDEIGAVAMWFSIRGCGGRMSLLASWNRCCSLLCISSGVEGNT